MSVYWLVAIGSEQSIPPRKIETEIAVRFPTYGRVMNTMHFRSHYQKAKKRIDLLREAHISVVKHGSPVQDYFKDQNGHWRSAGQEDRRHFDSHREDDLDGMEANPC